LKQKFANKDAKYLFSCAEAPGVPEGTNGMGGWVYQKAKQRKADKGREEGREEGEEEGEEEEEEEEEEMEGKEEPELWARVTGKLPRTANGLYTPPFIANLSDYDVRYVSLSSVGRSLPYRGYQTLHDADITEHYLREIGPQWLEDRKFTLWFGPPHVEVEKEGTFSSSSSSSPLPLRPAVVADEKALFLPWGRSFEGGLIPFPGVLYRQILSRGQVLKSMRAGGRTGGRTNSRQSSEKKRESERSCPSHAAVTSVATVAAGAGAAATVAGSPTASLAEIIPPTCERREEEIEKEEEVQPLHVVGKHMCCGSSAPEWCHDPGFVASKMKSFYPLVEYYHRHPKRGRGNKKGKVDEDDVMERIGGEDDDCRKMTLVKEEESFQPSCVEKEQAEISGKEEKEEKEVSLSMEEMAGSYLNLVSDIWTIIYSHILFWGSERGRR